MTSMTSMPSMPSAPGLRPAPGAYKLLGCDPGEFSGKALDAWRAEPTAPADMATKLQETTDFLLNHPKITHCLEALARESFAALTAAGFVVPSLRVAFPLLDTYELPLRVEEFQFEDPSTNRSLNLSVMCAAGLSVAHGGSVALRVCVYSVDFWKNQQPLATVDAFDIRTFVNVSTADQMGDALRATVDAYEAVQVARFAETANEMVQQLVQSLSF